MTDRMKPRLLLHEFKKAWRLFSIILFAAVLVWQMATLYLSMYDGRIDLLRQIQDVWSRFSEDSPKTVAGEMRDRLQTVDGTLSELQMEITMRGDEMTDAQVRALWDEYDQLQYSPGSFSKWLADDFAILVKIIRRVDHIDALADTWANLLQKEENYARRRTSDALAQARLNDMKEKFAALNVPEYANYDPIEDFVKWNGESSWLILLVVAWVCGGLYSMEKSTRMWPLLLCAMPHPRALVWKKLAACIFSSTLIITIQFLAGITVALIAAGDARTLFQPVQALYVMGESVYPIRVIDLLISLFGMQLTSAYAVMCLTIWVAYFVAEAWIITPIITFIVVCPNVIYSALISANVSLEWLNLRSVYGVTEWLDRYDVTHIGALAVPTILTYGAAALILSAIASLLSVNALPSKHLKGG